MTSPYIIFVDDYPGANIGGGEQHVLRVARGCREWGYRVGVVCIPGSGLDAEVRSAGFEALPMPTHRGLGVGRSLTRLFVDEAPDIVHVHGFYVMTVVCSAARRAGVRHVLTTVHTMLSAPLDLYPRTRGRLEFWLRAALYRLAARRIDRFVCVVDRVRRELVRAGVEASKTVVIQNGIPDPLATGRVRSKAHDDGLLVGSVGRLEAPKDYRTLVAAAAVVCEQRGDVRLRLVGDGILRASLRDQARDSGLGDRFELAGWSDDPLGEIAAMDVYVVSSVTDTTNLTIVEAMGLGVPVVATDVGGISEVVVDGETGVLVPSRRPDLLAQGILRLANDAGLRASMGAAGRERFASEFTVERMLAQHRALYDGLLGQAL